MFFQLLLLLWGTCVGLTLAKPWDAFMGPLRGNSKREYKGIGGIELVSDDEPPVILASRDSTMMMMQEIPQLDDYIRNSGLVSRGVRFPDTPGGNRHLYPQFPDRPNYNPYSSSSLPGSYRDNYSGSYRRPFTGIQ